MLLVGLIGIRTLHAINSTCTTGIKITPYIKPGIERFVGYLKKMKPAFFIRFSGEKIKPGARSARIFGYFSCFTGENAKKGPKDTQNGADFWKITKPRNLNSKMFLK